MGSSGAVETRSVEVQTLSFAMTATNDYVPRKVESYHKEVQTDAMEESDEEDQTASTDEVKPKPKEAEAPKEVAQVPEKAAEQKPIG